ncbi:hypothetical protein V6N13_113111 [Hibiscus sabdariffa]
MISIPKTNSILNHNIAFWDEPHPSPGTHGTESPSCYTRSSQHNLVPIQQSETRTKTPSPTQHYPLLDYAPGRII